MQLSVNGAMSAQQLAVMMAAQGNLSQAQMAALAQMAAGGQGAAAGTATAAGAGQAMNAQTAALLLQLQANPQALAAVLAQLRAAGATPPLPVQPQQ
jgi:hypothetical protein